MFVPDFHCFHGRMEFGFLDSDIFADVSRLIDFSLAEELCFPDSSYAS